MRSVSCDRARRWAALAPDGELSDLEARALARHCRRCDDCHRYRNAVEAVSAQLRAVPFEEPARRFDAGMLPRRRRVAVARGMGMAAAAAAAAVVALGIPGGSTGPVSEPTPVDHAFADRAERAGWARFVASAGSTSWYPGS